MKENLYRLELTYLAVKKQYFWIMVVNYIMTVKLDNWVEQKCENQIQKCYTYKYAVKKYFGQN